MIATSDCRPFGYVAENHWARLPPSLSWRDAVAVACDSRERVFVFNRGEHPVAIFDRSGTFLGAWGEGVFRRPHGLTIALDDSVWCTDDFDHTVRKFTLEGELLLTLGISGRPSDTGATSVDFRTIRRAAGPFHYPTNLALSHKGEIFVSDGYGNARIHKFSADGRFLFSWGEPGGGPGQFRIPHGIAVDQHGTVYVADRENSRIQLFTSDGRFTDEWRDVARPCQVFVDAAERVLVAELGFRAGMWPGISPPAVDSPGGRLSIFDRSGTLLARWGGHHPSGPGDFFAPHGLCVDSRGGIYVAEVVWSGGARDGLVSPDWPSLHKFSRKSS